jgi:hypothetical protein
MQDLTPVVADDEKAYKTPNVSVGTVTKSIAAMASRSLLSNPKIQFAPRPPVEARRIPSFSPQTCRLPDYAESSSNTSAGGVRATF